MARVDANPMPVGVSGHEIAPQERMSRPQVLRGAIRMSELGRRFLVAVVGVPVVATVIALGARPSAILFGAAAAIGCAEYYRLTTGPISGAAWVGIAAAAAMPLAPVVLPAARVAPALCGIVVGSSMLIWTIHLFAGPRAQAPERVGHLMAGFLFSSVGLAALSALRAGANGVAWTAIVLVATSANDTAAYFGGRALGRNKLWPAVSPQKTWEGLVAGFVGGILALLIMRPWLPRYVGADACVALGTLVGVLAPLGDLCKSMLKRAYHVKDTGHLLPGHGGLLDRIDGVRFVAPVIWLVRAILFPG